jgi:hypothetical protein
MPSQPRIGDKVWDQAQLEAGKQPNGRIKMILSYDEPRSYLVQFEDTRIQEEYDENQMDWNGVRKVWMINHTETIMH